jgi:hypothetical protein
MASLLLPSTKYNRLNLPAIKVLYKEVLAIHSSIAPYFAEISGIRHLNSSRVSSFQLVGIFFKEFAEGSLQVLS